MRATDGSIVHKSEGHLVQYHDDDFIAEGSIPIKLSHAKLRTLQPELYGLASYFKTFQINGDRLSAINTRKCINEHLSFGAPCEAMVVHASERLLVSAYSLDMDAVLLLEFPAWLIGQYHLQPGTRLLSINTYTIKSRNPMVSDPIAPDIYAGPLYTGSFTNYYPLIAEFLSDDLQIIEQCKAESSTPEDWKHLLDQTRQRMTLTNLPPRNGLPLSSMIPVSPMVRLR